MTTTLASITPLNQWVGWREEMVGGRLTKVPYDPRSERRAAADNPSTWTTHDEVQKWAEKQKLAGARQGAGTGVMLGPVNDNFGVLCGIDLDRCRDKSTGAIAPWARR